MKKLNIFKAYIANQGFTWYNSIALQATIWEN
ncbi:hypothetical protein HNQ03_001010 [Chryseobacterium sp. 16F]|uniref:Uncharacterized protein n=1 Tax=Frigoriflavimonas asaccharolytica TaxID=2735899 RepID=A0A8J8G6B8_9FLAO|nr:hypothetical protein [Frigoriflavimonas asaccharolytica]